MNPSPSPARQCEFHDWATVAKGYDKHTEGPGFRMMLMVFQSLIVLIQASPLTTKHLLPTHLSLHDQLQELGYEEQL